MKFEYRLVVESLVKYYRTLNITQQYTWRYSQLLAKITALRIVKVRLT